MKAILLLKDIMDMVLENDDEDTQLCFQTKDGYKFMYEIDWETGFVPEENVIVVRLK
jgi:hypothetical protein